MKNIVLQESNDHNGNSFASEFIFKSEENGVFYRQSIACWSSADLDLGTCLCHSHAPWSIEPCPIEELKGNGVELDIAARLHQQLAIAQTSWEELEQFCALSYKFGQNPLPTLRKLFAGFQVSFMSQSDSRSAYMTPAIPTVAVELADDGRVWIEKYTEWHEGLQYFVPQN